jgi:murein DD-endopeptidase MepM/ murein hydrolase activator NlpD
MVPFVRKSRALVALLVAVLVVGAVPAVVRAEVRTSDLVDELMEVSRAEARLGEQLEGIATRRAQLEGERALLEAGLAEAEAALAVADGALADAGADARRVARRLARTIADLDHARGVLQSQAISAFKAGGSARLLDQLLRADDLLSLGAVKVQTDAVLAYQDDVIDEVIRLRLEVERLDVAAKVAEAAAAAAREVADRHREALEADRARVVVLGAEADRAAVDHMHLLADVQERKRAYQLELATVAASSSSITQLLAATQAGQTVVPAERGLLVMPTPAACMSSSFGPRVHPIFGDPRMHTGVDFAAPSGTPIVAAAGGVVVMSGDIGGYGQTIVVDHGNGLSTLYAHQSRLVAGTGQAVGPGDVLGLVGSTGASTGPHLHPEVRVLGIPVDPVNYL